MTAYAATINSFDFIFGFIDCPLGLGRRARRAYHRYGQAVYPYAATTLRAALVLALAVLLVMSLILLLLVVGLVMLLRVLLANLSGEAGPFQPIALLPAAPHPSEERLAVWQAEAAALAVPQAILPETEQVQASLPKEVQAILTSQRASTSKLRSLATYYGIRWQNARGQGKHMLNKDIRARLDPDVQALMMTKRGRKAA